MITQFPNSSGSVKTGKMKKMVPVHLIFQAFQVHRVLGSDPYELQSKLPVKVNL
jgi:hypothetical protein